MKHALAKRNMMTGVDPAGVVVCAANTAYLGGARLAPARQSATWLITFTQKRT